MRVSSISLFAAALLLFGTAASGQVSSPASSADKKGGKPKRAVVEFSVNFMRENPDYAAELGDQALMGTVVELLDTSGYWVKIRTPEPYTAWVNDMGLVPMSDKEIESYLRAPKCICLAEHSHIYEEPSEGSRVVSEFVMGDIARMTFKDGAASEVRVKKFIGVTLPSGRTGYVPAKDVQVFLKWAEEKRALAVKDHPGFRSLADGRRWRNIDEDSFGEDIVSTALMFLGVPYMWGGTSIKNVDCSGLSRSVYFSNGVLLPRNASQQAKTGEDVNIFNDNGSVSWDALASGDLIFWGRAATDSTRERVSHVGIYIGGGKFIHSSEVVRINSLDSSSDDFYDRRPVRARRIIGLIDQPASGVISIRRSPDYFAE